MAMTDPVSVYIAPSNVEAQLICLLLVNAGIAAFVTEDMSPGGKFSLGTLGAIHRPEIWVERSVFTQAQSFIADFEHRQSSSSERTSTEFYCYHCGEIVEREVSICGSCGQKVEYLNDEQNRDDGAFEENYHENAPSSFVKLRTLKKPLALCFLGFLVFSIHPFIMMLFRFIHLF
jgi:hypothetical protein